MKKYQTSTNIVPIIDVGTYDSRLSWDGFWEWQAEGDRQEGYFVCDDYDFDKFKSEIVRACNNLFANECAHGDMLQKYGVKTIKATSMGSPKYYNYVTDWLDLEVEVEDDFLDRAEKVIMARENARVVEKYMTENWKSRDGYISSMPADCREELPEVFRMLREDDCGIDDIRAFGTVLMLLFVIEGHTEEKGNLVWGEEYWTERMIDDLQGNTCLGEFCTVMDLDEVEEKYGKEFSVKAFLETIDEAEKQLREGFEKYKSVARCKEGIESTEKSVKERLKKLDEYRNECRQAVEMYHPREKDVIDNLKEVKENYVSEFGDSPTRAKLGDLPGQEVMSI